MICPYCAHKCKLEANEFGKCGVNFHGKGLECAVYGYPEALHVDPIEKKPLYHVLPSSKTLSLGTAGCNFTCDFCQNWQLSQSKPSLNRDYFAPEDIVSLAYENGCSSIACTYNEPSIFFPYAKDIALSDRKLKHIWVSNGYFSPFTCKELPHFVDAMNIDLKAFNKDFYRQIGGDLNVVCDNLIKLFKAGVWIEITTLLIPGRNDNPEELRAIANFIAQDLSPHVPWHISAFHPAYKATNLAPTPKTSLQNAYGFGKDAGLYYVYMGNLGLPNLTSCPQCDNLLIERTHYDTQILGLDSSFCCATCKRPLEGVFQ
jgi:pyruvate formate lyase activating enzyme